MQNSPVVQKSESAHRESLWRVRESLTTFLPTVNASVNYLTQYRYVLTDINLGTPQSVPQVLPTSQLAITAQLPLFDGGASINKYRANRSLEISAENDFLWTQFKVSREILLQYFKVIAASTLKQVAEQNVKALSDHLRDVKLFKKAGVVTNFDVLKVEVQVSEAHSELLTRSDDIVLQRNRLSELLGLENDERAVNEKLPVLKEEMLQGRNFDQPTLRKDLFSLVSKTEALKFSSQSAGRYWVPRLNLFGQYLYYNNRSDHFSDQEDYRDAYQVGLQLTWNIFDGMSSIARSHEAVEQYYQAEKSLRLTQIKSKQEIDLWKRKFIYNCSIHQARVSDVEKSEESVRLASQGRKAGTRTNTDLLDAESELYRARAGLVNAQIGSIEALINLELATGSEIHNFF
ncbi:MAG: TolC family protein [Bdellovibrionales bacterium]